MRDVLGVLCRYAIGIDHDPKTPMNRLSILLLGLGLGLTVANACLAQDAQFCQSMCTSEQRECRANAQQRPKEESLMPPESVQRNPLARTAEGAVPGQGARALSAAGDTHRRLDRVDACNATQARCMRSCGAAPAGVKRPPAA